MHAKSNRMNLRRYLILQALFLIVMAAGAAAAVTAGLDPHSPAGPSAFAWPLAAAVLAAGNCGLARVLYGRRSALARRENTALERERRLTAWHARLLTEMSRPRKGQYR